MSKKYDVFGIGNAIVDILAFVPDEFIASHGLTKGSMTLVDASEQAAILNDLESVDLQLASGGSAANTMVAIAQSGGTGHFVGKVAADPNGEFYRNDMREAGIVFDVEPAAEASLPTGTSVILTTPDAERTMCTHLGISTSLEQTDADANEIAESQICYVEGYLWDGDQARAACVRAMELARKASVKVAFTFSDPFLVDRFGDDFKKLASENCDILFCNADEGRMFCGSEDLTECGRVLGEMVDLAFITDSANGCWVIEKGESTHVPGFSISALDTVGAGDAFAGGVLYGLTNGRSTTESAKWGNYFASEIVKINGPRLSNEASASLAIVD